MRRGTQILAVALLCIAARISGAVEAEKTQYRVEFRLYEVQAPDGPIAPIEATAVSVSTEERHEVVLTPPMTIGFGPVTLKTTKDSVAWVGDEKAIEAAVTLITRPSIMTLAGEPAEIRVGRKGPQYFERDPDGAYRLEAWPNDLGISLGCTIMTAKRKQVEMALKCEVSEMTGRESLEGVGLDVGRPIVSMCRVEKQCTVPLGTWMTLLTSSEDTQTVVLWRVTKVDF